MFFAAPPSIHGPPKPVLATETFSDVRASNKQFEAWHKVKLIGTLNAFMTAPIPDADEKHVCTASVAVRVDTTGLLVSLSFAGDVEVGTAGEGHSMHLDHHAAERVSEFAGKHVVVTGYTKDAVDAEGFTGESIVFKSVQLSDTGAAEQVERDRREKVGVDSFAGEQHGAHNVLYVMVKWQPTVYNGNTLKQPATRDIRRYIARSTWGATSYGQTADADASFHFGNTDNKIPYLPYYTPTGYNINAGYKEQSRANVQFEEPDATTGNLRELIVGNTLQTWQANNGIATKGCLHIEIANWVKQKLQSEQSGINNAYTHISYVLPVDFGDDFTKYDYASNTYYSGNFPGNKCKWGGKGNIGPGRDNTWPLESWSKTLYKSYNTEYFHVAGYMRTMFHELGHNFRAQHSMNTTDEYGDKTCIMGQGSAMEFNAPKRSACTQKPFPFG